MLWITPRVPSIKRVDPPGTVIHSRQDEQFSSHIFDEDEHPGPKRVQRPHRGGKALSGCRQLLYLAPEYSFNQCIAIGEVAIKSARPNLRAASNFVQRRPWPVLREGFPRDL